MKLREQLAAPIDALGLSAFRIAYGLLVFVSTVRFAANGWIDRFFVAPRFHFTYWGLGFVEPLSREGMIAVFVALAVAAACVALGLFYRVAIVLTVVLFAYVELIDVSLYLNHYYLVTLLGVLLCFMPAHAMLSIDARRDARIARTTVPAWTLYLLRFQVGCVYFFAGLAKLNTDWLLHAQPLSIWLAARTDMPLIGPLFREPWVAFAMSWGGFLYDTSIAFFLGWRRTRAVAFLAVIGFHTMVGALFPIGMFPFIMVVAATVFFDPSWLRRFVPAAAVAPVPRPPVGRGGMALIALYASVQLAMPLRALAYGGNVAWHEQGMRWAWRVMVREKNGAVTFRVRFDGRERHVYPCEYLNQDQEREMSSQPDLVLALAHHIADDFRARGARKARPGRPSPESEVEVRVDALVSLNGRPPARMIDPTIDLARVPDGVAPARWILPAPTEQPLVAAR